MRTSTTHNVRLTTLVLMAVIAVVLAHLADWWVLAHLSIPRFQETDLGRMFRIAGFIPLWICIAIAIVLCDTSVRTRRARVVRGALPLCAAIAGGIVAELAKILIRRERPNVDIEHYVFRSWSGDALYSGGFGLPSSHVLVAFAALAMLGYLYPRARILWFVLGAGCAFSRVAAGAHFVSDVVVAAVLGYIVAGLIWRYVASRDPANAIATSSDSPAYAIPRQPRPPSDA